MLLSCTHSRGASLASRTRTLCGRNLSPWAGIEQWPYIRNCSQSLRTGPLTSRCSFSQETKVGSSDLGIKSVDEGLSWWICLSTHEELLLRSPNFNNST